MNPKSMAICIINQNVQDVFSRDSSLKSIKVATNPIGYYISRDTQLFFANLDNIKHNQDEIKNFVYSNFNKNEITEKIDFLIFTMKHLTQSILTNKTEKIINIINLKKCL